MFFTSLIQLLLFFIIACFEVLGRLSIPAMTFFSEMHLGVF
jgi:hypothetical protein